jgi:hypothetical protein
LYQKKAAKKSPQDVWMDAVANATSEVSKAPDNIRVYLTRLSTLGNVPRNKGKFLNFAKNSLKIYSDPICNAIWDFLDATAKIEVPKPTPQPVIELEQDVAEQATEDVVVTKEKKHKAEKDKDNTKISVVEDGVDVKEEIMKKSKKHKRAKAVEEEAAEEEEEVVAEKKHKKSKKHRKSETEE